MSCARSVTLRNRGVCIVRRTYSALLYRSGNGAAACCSCDTSCKASLSDRVDAWQALRALCSYWLCLNMIWCWSAALIIASLAFMSFLLGDTKDTCLLDGGTCSLTLLLVQRSQNVLAAAIANSSLPSASQQKSSNTSLFRIEKATASSLLIATNWSAQHCWLCSFL